MSSKTDSSTASAVPPFNSTELWNAVKKNADIFKCQKDNIIAVSEDITELEKFLQANAVLFPFKMYCNIDEIHNRSYYLEWAEHTNGKMRLLYTLEAVDAFGDGTTILESKPLIEASATTRTLLYHFLDRFVVKFAELLGKKSPQIGFPF